MCGGKGQARGHWDVSSYEKKTYIRVPKTYRQYNADGGDGPCENARHYHDVSKNCEDAWSSCGTPVLVL